MESVHHLHKLSFKGKSIRQAFCGYFNADLFTDCTLIGACGNFLRVHRSILSPVSDYFAVSIRSYYDLSIKGDTCEIHNFSIIPDTVYASKIRSESCNRFAEYRVQRSKENR